MKMQSCLVLGFMAFAAIFSVSTLASDNQRLSLPELKRELGPILQNKKTQRPDINQFDAENACCAENQGFNNEVCEQLTSEQKAQLLVRLPTVLELARISENIGAQGIRDTNFGDRIYFDRDVQDEIAAMKQDKYYPIYTKNSSGQVAVGFYFSHQNYEPTKFDLGAWYFWSSTVSPIDSDLAYALRGAKGGIGPTMRNSVSLSAVRCVQSTKQ